MTRDVDGFRRFTHIWNKANGRGTPAHHLVMADWLEKIATTPPRRGLLLAFRASGKSSMVGLFLAWLLRQDPDMRVLVVSADERLAKKMVRNVRRIIELHPLTQGLMPKGRREEWAAGSFTIERPSTLRDPSVSAIGLGGNTTGSRADVIICDDVEVPRNSGTRAKREDLREKLTELQFVLTPGGAQIFIGTPHAADTIYRV